VKDYNVTIKIRNNCLLHWMRFNGIENASQLSKLTGVQQTTIGGFLNLKISAVRPKDGRWRDPVLKISQYLKVLPEDLFPIEHIKNPLKENTKETEISKDELIQLTAGVSYPSEEERLIGEQEKEIILKAIKTLSSREENIIIERFGFDGEPKTLCELSKKYKVSPNRIRQIEEKALHKLRRTPRRKLLLPYE